MQEVTFDSKAQIRAPKQCLFGPKQDGPRTEEEPETGTVQKVNRKRQNRCFMNWNRAFPLELHTNKEETLFRRAVGAEEQNR